MSTCVWPWDHSLKVRVGAKQHDGDGLWLKEAKQKNYNNNDHKALTAISRLPNFRCIVKKNIIYIVDEFYFR